MTTTIEGPVTEQSAACDTILRSLPEWFGIESANAAYVEAAGRLPSFIATADGEVVGIACVERHFPETAEIHLIAIRPEHHRAGIGRELLERVEAWLRADGVELLEVKTLSASSPDVNYAKTRAFYLGMGFRPLEEIKTLWDERNPCLILVKVL